MLKRDRRESMSLVDIVEEEKNLVCDAERKYGDFFIHALDFNAFLHNFIKSISPDGFIFAMFLADIKKHHTLAVLSAARLHHVQCALNLRRVLEAGANAAYAIAKSDLDCFRKINEEGLLETPQELADKRNKWLDENYPEGSFSIKGLKKSINQSCAHSNITYTQQNFQMEKKSFRNFFFDTEDGLHVKTNFWFAANVAMGLVDLFYGVNKNRNVITFSDDFLGQLRTLKTVNDSQRQTIMDNPRIKPNVEKLKNSEDGNIERCVK